MRIELLNMLFHTPLGKGLSPPGKKSWRFEISLGGMAPDRYDVTVEGGGGPRPE